VKGRYHKQRHVAHTHPIDALLQLYRNATRMLRGYASTEGMDASASAVCGAHTAFPAHK
jgi:hypothetical protein